MTDGPTIPVWRRMEPTPFPADMSQEVPVLIVGAGPIGLAMALDLARRGHQIVVVTKLDFIPGGSKAICFAKRSLEIFDRLGVGDRMVAKGVAWNVGKIFRGAGTEPLYQFDLLPVKEQKRPAFINLQQYYVEQFLVEALAQYPGVDIRWGHEVVACDRKTVSLRAQGRSYQISAEWIIACDGSRSPLRHMLGLDFDGRIFEDHFLIADIRTTMTLPPERWFWFDPPFNPGQSALLHRQPDDIWRLDFQLGRQIDRQACITPEAVAPLVRGMLGEDVAFTPEWYSVYSFQCRRMKRFVHDRVIFAGDSAHLVSPFGARGCNGGIADIDNLGWKLDLVLRGAAPETLLESYNDEAIVAADENILNSTRSTDFLTPKSAVSQAFRDAVLDLAECHPFARHFVNSGRLSTAIGYPGSPLNTADSDEWIDGPAPGSPAIDAPLGDEWLLDRLGDHFVLLAEGWSQPVPAGAELLDIAALPGADLARQRYDLTPGAAYLIRPDQYCAARWRAPAGTGIEAAIRKAMGE